MENLLREEIALEFDGLRAIEIGTTEYKNAVEGLSKLMDRAIEMEKITQEHEEKCKNREFEIKKLEAEREEKCKNREFDYTMKIMQMESEDRDRLIKNIISGVTVGSGIVLTVWGTLKTLKFEETGVITTSAGRKFINGILSAFKK